MPTNMADQAIAKPLRLAFYGDDFTGSTDALEVLAFAGFRCALFLETPTLQALEELGGFDAIGIAGESRGMSPSEMDKELPPILEALERLQAPVVHYKVCSTFDSSPTIGSIGHVMELARNVFGTRMMPIIAGTPSLSRYCAFGNLFARSGTDGKTYRIDKHPIMSVHPVTPMHEGDLTVHLSRQTAIRIQNFALPNFELDLPERDGALDRTEVGALLFDSITEAHLTEVGRLLEVLASKSRTTFVVGSSGVEYALTQHWRATGREGSLNLRFDAFDAVDQVLAISGSASALSALQIDAALASGFVDVPLDAALLVDEVRWKEESQLLSERVIDLLRQGRSVMLHTARGPQDKRIAKMIDSLVARGETSDQARHRGGRLLGERLGLIVQNVLQAVPLRRLLLSGGDTSSQITKVLAPDALEVAARLAPGAPLCRAISKKPHLVNLQIALKGGQMGSQDYFVKALKGTA